MALNGGHRGAGALVSTMGIRISVPISSVYKGGAVSFLRYGPFIILSLFRGVKGWQTSDMNVIPLLSPPTRRTAGSVANTDSESAPAKP